VRGLDAPSREAPQSSQTSYNDFEEI